MACRSDELRGALQNASEVAGGAIEARVWAFLTQAFLRKAVVRQARRDPAFATRSSPRSDRRSFRPASVNPAAPPNPGDADSTPPNLMPSRRTAHPHAMRRAPAALGSVRPDANHHWLTVFNNKESKDKTKHCYVLH